LAHRLFGFGRPWVYGRIGRRLAGVAVGPELFRAVMGHFATGVRVVVSTVPVEGKPDV
jgi:hypothetical protein